MRFQYLAPYLCPSSVPTINQSFIEPIFKRYPMFSTNATTVCKSIDYIPAFKFSEHNPWHRIVHSSIAIHFLAPIMQSLTWASKSNHSFNLLQKEAAVPCSPGFISPLPSLGWPVGYTACRKQFCTPSPQPRAAALSSPEAALASPWRP